MAASTALRVAVLAAVLLLPFLSVPAEAQTKRFCLTQFAIANQACAILPPTSPESHHHHHHNDEDEDEDEDEDNDDQHDDQDDDDHGGGDHDRGRVRRNGPVDYRKSSAAAQSPMSMITVEPAVDDDDESPRNGTDVSAGNHTRSSSSSNNHPHHISRSRRHRHRRRRRRSLHGGRLGDGDDDEHEDNDEDEDEDEDEDNDEDDDEDEDEDDDDGDNDHRAYRDCCRWLKEVEPDCVCEAMLRLPTFLIKPQHRYTVRVGRTCRFTYRCGGV
jgi:hypothetical protein